MCVICHVPANETLTEDRLNRLWDTNPHGGGLAYVSRRNNIVVEKTMDKDEFKEKVNRVQSFSHRADLLLHMRIATHGSVSIPNVHPFRVNTDIGREDLVMAHNGIISKVGGKRTIHDGKHKGKTAPVDDRSDTRMFIDEVLNLLPLNWLDNPATVQLVEDFIGGSKLMFLSTRPELRHRVYILNKEMGTERGDMWFSNSGGVDPVQSWKPKRGKYSSDYWAAYDGWGENRYKAPALKTNARELVAYNKYLRTQWERFVAEATEQQIAEHLQEFELIQDDRKSIFSKTAATAFEFDGQKWMCLSCYMQIDFDEKTGFTDCLCFNRECLECDEECFQCRCDLRPKTGIKNRRVRDLHGGKVTVLKKGGDA